MDTMKSSSGVRGERGAVIIVALFLLILIGVLMIGLSLLHRSDLDAVSNQIEDLQAYYCAEAGIERAYLSIRNTANWPTAGNPFNGTVWTNQTCYDAGNAGIVATGDTYTVQATEVRADPNDTTTYNYIWITSTAKLHDSRFQKSIRVLIHRTKVVQNQGGNPMCPTCYYAQILLYQVI